MRILLGTDAARDQKAVALKATDGLTAAAHRFAPARSRMKEKSFQ